MEICNSGSWEVIIWYCRCVVCGQGILRCKCGSRNDSWSRWPPLLEFHFIKCSQSWGQWESKSDGATLWLSASQLHISLVSDPSDLLLPLLNCTLQLRRGKEQSIMYRLCSSISPKWLVWDCGMWTGLSQVCCPATLLLPQIL